MQSMLLANDVVYITQFVGLCVCVPSLNKCRTTKKVRNNKCRDTNRIRFENRNHASATNVFCKHTSETWKEWKITYSRHIVILSTVYRKAQKNKKQVQVTLTKSGSNFYFLLATWKILRKYWKLVLYVFLLSERHTDTDVYL